MKSLEDHWTVNSPEVATVDPQQYRDTLINVGVPVFNITFNDDVTEKVYLEPGDTPFAALDALYGTPAYFL